MKKVTLAILVSCVFAVLGSGCPSSTEVELTIFHTNDIHSHLKPAKTDPFGLGGLARISTLLQQLRKSHPVSLTIDAGDWSEGTWYFSLDTGANILRMFDAMNYDAAALGNHDFFSGPERVIQTIQLAHAGFPVLAANLDTSAFSDGAQFNKAVIPSVIKQVGGLKVGIIGLTTFEFVYDSYIAPVKIMNPVDYANAEAKRLRPQVDVLLLASHNSFEANQQIAKAVLGIDGVISGHSHYKIPRAVMIENAGRQIPVVETGCWGKFLGDLKFTVNTTTHAVSMKSYELHPVSPDIAEDPKVAAMVASEDARLNAKFNDNIDRVVAKSEFDMPESGFGERPLGTLAAKAYRASTGVDIGMEANTFLSVGISKGDATLMDMHDIMPHIYDASTGKEWTIQIWNAKGNDLFLLLNAFYSINFFGWPATDNVQVTLDTAGLFAAPHGNTWSGNASPLISIPIQAMTVGGKPFDSNTHYRVALTGGILRGIQIANDKFHLGIDISDLQDTGIEAWRSIVKYAESAGTLKVDDLRVGNRVRAKGADLAVYEYDVDYDGENLSVEVDNVGMTASTQAKLTCYSGLPNDVIAFGTDLQKWTQIATSSVDPVQPGHFAQFEFPWKPAGSGKTVWPVRCTVSGGGDTYSVNNSIDRTFTTD